MRKCFYVIFLIAFAVSLSFAFDVDTIFIWDNDRGKSVQTKPAVGIIGGAFSGGFPAWQDARWGDFDIYRQRFVWDSTLIGSNTQVSFDDFNQFQQTNVDITGNPQNGCIAVWEDSVYRPYEKPAQIWCRIYNDDPIKVYELDASQKLPAISSRMNGYFVVTWTCYSGAPWPSIFSKYYDDTGHEFGFNVVRQRDSIVEYPPVSRVAYCDSGCIIVYEDESNDGTGRSIYAQYCDKDGNIKMDHKKISHLSGDSRHEQCPDVAINEDGNIVVVWEDYRFGDADIYIQRLQAKNDRFEFVGLEMEIMTTVGVDELCPRIAVFPNGSFVVVWYDKRSGDYDAFYRAFIGGELRTPHRIPQNNGNDQMYPNIDTRYGEFSNYISMVWASQAISMYDDVFMRNFKYNDQAGTGLDSITGDIPLVPINPDTCVGGRKCWYFDDENYDNPATAWNEDPIPEPESVYVDLEFAMVDQIMELNTNGQYFIVCEDTLPIREQGEGRGLSGYAAIFLDLGYRTTLASAGQITSMEQDSLTDYINPSGADGKPVMVDGNDFGYMYDGTEFFKLFGAKYMGDGAHYEDGNIDTIFGIEDLFTGNETLMYDYKEMVDNYIDSLDALPPAKLLLYSSGAPTEWYAGRAVFYGSYWKSRERGGTIYNSFIPAGITSTTHPHTYAEYYRRCLGWLGLNCQPEPITTLQAHTDTTETPEGRVVMKWQVVSDDSLPESAAGPYKLKFAREKMTSDSAFDDAEEYYQTWNTGDSTVGDWVTESLYGLPPMDTLVFALKVSDESSLWNALGAEPQVIVGGDAVTPHKIVIADNYVKDFSNKFELIEVDDDIPSDSLFVTWDGSNIYFGFTKRSFQNGADLLIYIDLTTGGADSTMPRNGASNRAYFDADEGIFHPEYCLVLENSTLCSLYQCTAKDGRDTWTGIAFSGEYSHDNIVNGYEYTEIWLPFSNISYISSNPFKLVVTVQQEWFNTLTTVFPIYNQTGSSATISQYYYWGYLDDDMVPNQTFDIIGIEDNDNLVDADMFGRILLAIPNPFASTIHLYLNSSIISPGKHASLRIFDVTGRLVRDFDLTSILQNHTPKVTWDGADDLGNCLPGGVYFCEFICADKTEIEKIIYIR